MKHILMIKPALILKVVAVMSLGIVQPSLANTLTVCPVVNCQYATIDAALTAAKPGDTIQLGKAVYDVNLKIGTDITLQGEDVASTVLDGGSRDTVVGIGAGATVTLKKVTVTHGGINYGVPSSGSGYGIINYGVLTLEQCSVEQNHGVDVGGINNTGNLIVRHSVVSDNFGFLADELLNSGIASLENSTIWSKSPSNNPIVNNGTLTIVESTVSSKFVSFRFLIMESLQYIVPQLSQIHWGAYSIMLTRSSLSAHPLLLSCLEALHATQEIILKSFNL
jgi:hypothetical protein